MPKTKKSRKTKKKEEKIKEINLPMKFNPGTLKYEPKLPLRKTNEKIPLKNKLKWILILILIMILLVVLLFLLTLF